LNQPVEREVVAPADLSWRGQQPYNESYQDIYHAEDGDTEVRRMFVEPSRLADRARDQRSLLIGELGFGTGLNFVTAAQLCLQARTRLHFVSFDAAPIAPDAFAAICARRQQRHSLYTQLRECYPPLIAGWHRRYLADGAITLSLFWGDAANGLDDIRRRQRRGFDIWFLDGFAPDRNPDMWSQELLARVGELSAQGSSVATYTSASRVRRGLEAAGFAMRRVDQRPHKPQSLVGEYQGTGRPKVTPPTEVVVIGAGLAGASVARHLADRGIRVRVVEAGSAPAQGASGIPATVLHPRLLADASPHAALRCHAYLYSNAYCDRFLDASPGGALQLPGRTASAERLEQIAENYAPSGDWLALLSASDACAKANWKIHTPALWFPHSRVLDTPALCRALLDHGDIELTCETQQKDLSDALTVLACGAQCRDFPAAGYLEIAPVHGQVDMVRMTSPPTLPLVGNGYLVPHGDHIIAGATYEYTPWEPQTATLANLEQLDGDVEWLSRARATRCVSSDRTPIAGRLYDENGTALPNTFVSTGHGSMGNVFSHLAGALVASEICGEFAPMTQALQSTLSAQRFRVRQARRGARHSIRP
jgi:tRNA 5-methylaminomethyl-2-thiouridine biosynthesis bifunctional protein